MRGYDGPSTISSMPNEKDGLDFIQQLATIAALGIGGFGAYFRFLKGRIYYTRLETDLKVNFVKRDGDDYLQCSVSVKNIGTSNVAITKGSNFLKVDWAPRFSRSNICLDPEWREGGVYEVLLGEENIEPGEAVTDEITFSTPLNAFVLNLVFECYARKSWFQFRLPGFRSGEEHIWKSRRIVYLPEG